MMKKALALTAALMSSNLLAEVTVVDQYVRAVPPGQPNSAAFMVLKNNDAAVSLVSASSSVAKVVELHTHTHKDGVMQMRKIDKVDVAAKGEAALAPGGNHVMLIGLTQQLKEGQQVDLTLKFSDGSSQQLTAPVRSVMKMGMSGGHKHKH